MRIPLSLRAAAALGLGAALMIPTMAHAQKPAARKAAPVKKAAPASTGAFNVEAEGFADLQMLRFQIPGFSALTPKQKELAYYLYEAALCGRDMIYDQKSKYGITLRKTIEAIYGTYNGDKSGAEWEQFRVYAGQFWFSSGNHHHYGNEKFFPQCSQEYFRRLIAGADQSKLPFDEEHKDLQSFSSYILPIIYDANIEPKLVDLRPNIDNVTASSVNFYEGVTQAEVEKYYEQFDTKGDAPSWGLNSKLVKQDGEIRERIWNVSGM